MAEKKRSFRSGKLANKTILKIEKHGNWNCNRRVEQAENNQMIEHHKNIFQIIL